MDRPTLTITLTHPNPNPNLNPNPNPNPDPDPNPNPNPNPNPDQVWPTAVLAYSCSWDGSLKEWDVPTGACSTSLHTSKV